MGILKDHAGGKYMRSDDISGVQKEFGIVAEITDFTEADVSRSDDPQSEVKPVIHFSGDLKPMVLNTTNLNMVLSLFKTDREDQIIGQRIGIYVDDRVAYQGKLVKGLRLCDHKEISTEQKSP